MLLTSITAQRGIQGATNKTLTVIDTHDELRQDSIQTLAHELDHVRGGKNETLADLAGLAAKLNTDAAIIANQDTINPIKAQFGDGKDAQTTAQNQALLNQNNQIFIENHDGREGEWEYAIPHDAGGGGRGGGMPMGGATGAGFAIGGTAHIVNNARQSASRQQSQQAVANSASNQQSQRATTNQPQRAYNLQDILNPNSEKKEDLLKLVAEARSELPSRHKRSGNVAVAEIDISGIQKTMKATSSDYNITAGHQKKGFVGEGKVQNLPAHFVTAGNEVLLHRSIDAEYKILNNIAMQLGNNRLATGSINLLTEKRPCASCSTAIKSFKEKYPYIQLNIYHNDGRIVDHKQSKK